MKTYSESYCNEFNVFLYFKDHSYFETVVKPFLSNKIEKTFIDFWLLSITPKILEWASIQKSYELNAFERCMLVKTLVAEGKVDRAKEIAESMLAAA